jgi:hypothetical protein
MWGFFELKKIQFKNRFQGFPSRCKTCLFLCFKSVFLKNIILFFCFKLIFYDIFRLFLMIFVKNNFFKIKKIIFNIFPTKKTLWKVIDTILLNILVDDWILTLSYYALLTSSLKVFKNAIQLFLKVFFIWKYIKIFFLFFKKLFLYKHFKTIWKHIKKIIF